RVEIGLAVPAGAPHPDISTVAQLSSALRSAKMVVYSKPGPPRNSVEAGIIDTILKQPEFTGVHSTPVETGSGIMALVHGEGDMAMQVIPEITPHKEVELVGPLPAKLGAHSDTAIAISARSGDAPDARAFIRYIMGPHAKAVWKVKGLDRFYTGVAPCRLQVTRRPKSRRLQRPPVELVFVIGVRLVLLPAATQRRIEADIGFQPRQLGLDQRILG